MSDAATIYKYLLSFTDAGTWVPVGQVVLIAEQHGALAAWVMHNPSDAYEEQRLVVTGTGQPVPTGTHVGSAICGQFVWHVLSTGVREVSP